VKVFIGTLECGEADFSACKRAIASQADVVFEHIVVSNQPEREAHINLYSSWIEARSDFDLFLKIDADTVLANDYVLKTYVELFEQNNRLTGVQAWLHDYMTNTNIYGLTCIKNTVTINIAPELYCDRVDSNHDIVIRGDELPTLLRPAGYHCHYASEKQAFHYGVHRAKKNQVDVRNKIKTAWELDDRKDRIRGMALLGFEMSASCSEFDYSSNQFQNLYAEAEKKYDSFKIK
jgi:hypothetical protein